MSQKKFRGGSGQIYFRGDLNLGGDLKFWGGADTPHDTMGSLVRPGNVSKRLLVEKKPPPSIL